MATKRIIAERAGHRCSFPNCGRNTSAPGAQKNQSSNSGVAAHIYSASHGGPRGRAGLTDDELKQAENGIWLCRLHGDLIDTNAGQGFPSGVLHSYKGLHENRIQKEVFGFSPIVGWIHEIKVTGGSIFLPNQKVSLGKLNLLFGSNETGKSAIVEWLMGAFDHTSRAIARWTDEGSTELDIEIIYLKPEPVILSTQLNGLRPFQLRVGTESQPFNPFPIRFICPRKVDGILDDVLLLSEILGLPPLVLENLIADSKWLLNKRVKNLRFERVDDFQKLRADVEGTAPGLSFRSLSSGERARVIVELSIAIARFSGRECPTVLVLDDYASAMDHRFFDEYSEELLSPQNPFQTIICLPAVAIELDEIEWRGWHVIRTNGRPPQVVLGHSIREKEDAFWC